MNLLRKIRVAATLLPLAGAVTACAGGGAGGLGNILGSVLGGQQQGQQQGQQGGQVQGTVRGVDQTRLALQLTNGQQVTFAHDRQTTVTYQNQRYAVTNLEPGDQVTAAVQETGNGGYYVSAVRVDRSVQESGGGGTASGNGTGAGERVQGVQGVVRALDTRNGQFTLEVGNGSRYVVSLPYNVSRADDERFRALRAGDQVRFYGVLLNSTRIELQRFY